MAVTAVATGQLLALRFARALPGEREAAEVPLEVAA